MPPSSTPQKLLFQAATDTAASQTAPGSESPLTGSRKGLKSPIAWYGGKAYYAEWLIERFPEHRVYIEPFGGAANVLLRKPKSEVEVYNDVDDRVVNLFRVVRDPEQFERLRLLLDLTPYARAEFADLLDLPPTDDPVEKARRFFAICRQARGGMGMSKLSTSCWAFSRRTRRSMAEPVSKYLSAIDGLEDVAARLRTVMIESRAAIELIPRYDGSDSFFYLDPPYMPETRHGNKAATYAHEMTGDDHAALLDALLQIKGQAMLSGYSAPLYEEKLKAWRREELKTKAHMANSGEERIEVIWFNY
jgi:DNA adenine methylase